MLAQVCLFQKHLIEKNKEPIERYNVPKHLIEIECIETAMTYNTKLSIELLGQLKDLGFSITMDDFGKAYSALNTLRTMPIDIVKRDSDFFQAKDEEEIIKAKKIISRVISLVHDLSLKVVAEGVETKRQYLFLKSIGCDYIQGYYFFIDLITNDKRKD